MEQLPDTIGGSSHRELCEAGIIWLGGSREQGVVFHISSVVLPLGEIDPKIPNHLFFAGKFFIKLIPWVLFIRQLKGGKALKNGPFSSNFTH